MSGEDCHTESIIPLEKRHAAAAADLHIRSISTGFLSSLGPAFLKQIYKALPRCPVGFGYVWEDDGRVLGFVACAESTGRLYKQSLLRRGLLMAILLLRFACRPSVIKRLWQTLRYPADVGNDVPTAELLSIVVAESARGRGVGQALVAAAIEEFRRRGIDRFKVAVLVSNKSANAFYKRCGFEHAMQHDYHERPTNIYIFNLEAMP